MSSAAATLVIPGITDLNTLVCISRARKLEPFKKAVADALAGRCPFCDIDRAYNVVVIENVHCLAWLCEPPEDNTRLHFLVVPKKHVTCTDELSDDELVTIFEVKEQLQEMYEFNSCGVLIRDGDATLSAGTIQHLHMHVMVPAGTGRVESPFFKGAESETESLARAIVFQKLCTGTRVEELDDAERALVKDRI